MKKSAFKIVVFDMAGTTVNEGGLVYKTMQSTIKGYGYPATQEQIQAIGGMSKKEAIAQILAEARVQDESLINKVYQNLTKISCKIMKRQK
jgi:beta-phosphoglucomutase-like phosphatase (HAD superfamily)